MKHLFLFLATVFTFSVSFAQSYQLNYGGGDKAKLDAIENGRSVSVLTFNQSGENTKMNFDLSGIGATTAQVRFYSNGKPVYEETTDANSGGPSVPAALMNPKELLYEGEVTMEEDALWGIVIAAVVLCCVEAEVGSDGWSVGFDCDCLEGALSSASSGGASGVTVVADGKTFEGVTEIQISPVDGEKNLLDRSNIKN
jgi:hypothetical protein